MVAFGILDLPEDLLAFVISNVAEPRELARLERTCQTLARLVGPDAWAAAFHSHRRPNVLGLRNADCKAEFERRERWSRSWRTLYGSSARATAPTLSQYRWLRRQALKLLPSVGPWTGSHRSPDALHVDPTRAGAQCFRTIGDALACAKPHDRVFVAPGTYHEHLELDKSVDIVGLGGVGAVVLQSAGWPVLKVSCKVACRVAGLAVRQVTAPRGGPMSGAVRVDTGGVLFVEEVRRPAAAEALLRAAALAPTRTRGPTPAPDPALAPNPSPPRLSLAQCTVTSETGHCVVVKGGSSHVCLLHSEVRNAKGVGVLFCEGATGLIEDNDIHSNERAGVAVLTGACPTIRANRIHDGHDSGVLVSEKGKGVVEGNDIYANTRAGVAILREGAPCVKHNWIHDGRDSGVLVCDFGRGSLIENEIYGNQMAGVAIGHGGESLVERNTIRDGAGGSVLCLSAASASLIKANMIDRTSGSEMQMPPLLSAEVQANNVFCSMPIHPPSPIDGGHRARVFARGVAGAAGPLPAAGAAA